MTAKELKEALANVPDDAVIAFNFGAYNAVEVQETEFDEYQNTFYISQLMTLQEKIDKLPLSIIFGQRLYVLNVILRSDIVRIIYRCNQPIARDVIMNITNYNSRTSLSQRLEDVTDRALKVIENKEWENKI